MNFSKKYLLIIPHGDFAQTKEMVFQRSIANIFSNYIFNVTFFDENNYSSVVGSSPVKEESEKTAETKRSIDTLNGNFCYIILRLRIALYLVGKSNIQFTSFELNVIQRIPPIHAQTVACACTF